MLRVRLLLRALIFACNQVMCLFSSERMHDPLLGLEHGTRTESQGLSPTLFEFEESFRKPAV